MIDKRFSGAENIRHKLPVTAFFLILFGSLIIPVRGGVGLAPINAGTVYFSENMFANHASINVVWNVGSSYFNRKPSVNPYSFGDLDRAVAIRDSLTVKTDTSLMSSEYEQTQCAYYYTRKFRGPSYRTSWR